MDVLSREFDRHRRHRLGLSVLMLDIDGFKAVNDLHGHAAGDRVFRHVAAVTARTVRGIDTLARYGGEEFVVVAPDTGRSQARRLAERIREALETSAPPVADFPFPITASIGVATIRDAVRRLHQLAQPGVAPGERLLAASGIASIVFAVIFALRPDLGAVTGVIGVYAIVSGLLLLAFAFHVRTWPRITPTLPV